MAKPIYVHEWITQKEMVKQMEENTLNEIGVPLTFNFEICNGTERHLYIIQDSTFLKNLDKMIAAGWFVPDIKDELEIYGEIENIFNFTTGKLTGSDLLFNYILGQTYGKGTKVINLRKTEDYYDLMLTIPMKYKLFKNTSLI